MRFEFVVTVEVERTEGKFSSREDIAAQIMEELEGADPSVIEGENGGQYETVCWEIEESPIKKKR